MIYLYYKYSLSEKNKLKGGDGYTRLQIYRTMSLNSTQIYARAFLFLSKSSISIMKGFRTMILDKTFWFIILTKLFIMF